ncbi:GNAT family N-acetyltransferase [Catenulispora pinisilvae]|uniref:GNAT family N-acetyltransferase n=1 Tax=Catenulispora pinisilvae TaxID=2705253 RepID=UPI001890DB9E|nr:GNAT family N-acetyltransferase [Catenulispora pinisilvae]
MADLVIASIEPADSGEVLTLQRAAYVTEAQLYDDWSFPALIQSHQELQAELAQSFALKAVRDGRIIGAVRARRDEAVWRIWRLTVAPDAQGLGIGTRLLAEVERRAPAGVERFALFTGHLSVENIRLYERLGYQESRREMLKSGIELVHLEKVAG